VNMTPLETVQARLARLALAAQGPRPKRRNRARVVDAPLSPEEVAARALAVQRRQYEKAPGRPNVNQKCGSRSEWAKNRVPLRSRGR